MAPQPPVDSSDNIRIVQAACEVNDTVSQDLNPVSSSESLFFRPWEQIGGGKRKVVFDPGTAKRQRIRNILGNFIRARNNTPDTQAPSTPTTGPQPSKFPSTSGGQPTGPREQSTADPQPSTSRRLPSAIDPQPSTSRGLPSTVDPQPSTSQGLPSIVDPEPSTSQGLPSTVDPQPSTSRRPSNGVIFRTPGRDGGLKRPAEQQIASLVEKIRRIAGDPSDSVTSGFKNRQVFVRWSYGGPPDVLRCLSLIRRKILNYITFY